MFKPRGTFVLVRLRKQTEEKVGNIAVPAANDQFCEGEIVALGPGVVDCAGADNRVEDLAIGQVVLVKHQKVMVAPDGIKRRTTSEGIPVRERFSGGERDLVLFDQHNIIGIFEDVTKPLKIVD